MFVFGRKKCRNCHVTPWQLEQTCHAIKDTLDHAELHSKY